MERVDADRGLLFIRGGVPGANEIIVGSWSSENCLIDDFRLNEEDYGSPSALNRFDIHMHIYKLAQTLCFGCSL